MFYFLILSFFSTVSLGIPLIKKLMKEKDINHLLFLTFCNALFFLTTTYFYYTIHETFLAFFSSFFLFGYALLLSLSLKKEKTFYLSFPYLLFTLCFFLFLIFEIFF